MSNSDTQTMTAFCFCGGIHFSIDVPKYQLPLSVHLCHCSRCRYMSGAPCVFHSVLPSTVKPKFIAPSSMDNMTLYKFEGASTSWAFCSKCGCHIASIQDKDDSWVVSASIFNNHGDPFLRIKSHMHAASTGDGGIATMLRRVGNRPMLDKNPSTSGTDDKKPPAEPEIGEDGVEQLRAQCHCGGVSFAIRGPSQVDRDDGFLKKYISPEDKTKWKACLDMCEDCRILNGTHVIGWAFIPLSSCTPPIKSDLKIGTAKTFSSSEGVLRSFCGTCGATVFYTCDDRKHSEGKQVVDVATGILRAPEGTMALDWLTWRTSLGFWESGKWYDDAFGNSLHEGMREWSMEKYGKHVEYTID